VDAAARRAVVDLASGYSASQAQTDAIALAAQNSANGAPVTLTAANIVIGHWHTSTKIFSPNTTPYNAVQVSGGLTAAGGNAIALPLAALIGQRSCEVHASAIAMFKPSGYGVVGLNYIKMGGNTSTSYWSTSGSTSSNYGSIASNGDITLSGSSYVWGNAQPGVSKAVSNPGLVSGSSAALTTPLVYPNGDAGSYATTNDDNFANAYRTGPSGQDLSLKAGDSPSLPGGNYYFHDLNLGGGSTLSFTGPATLYIWHNVTMNGNTNTSGNLPGNLKIVVCPSTTGTPPGTVKLSGTSALYANVYAPQSAITFNGTGDLYGSLLGLSIDMSGTAAIHYDLSLDSGAGSVVMVK
jgi:hypothetical protein